MRTWYHVYFQAKMLFDTKDKAVSHFSYYIIKHSYKMISVHNRILTIYRKL